MTLPVLKSTAMTGKDTSKSSSGESYLVYTRLIIIDNLITSIRVTHNGMALASK